MELQRYLKIYRKFWLVPALLLVAGLGGVYIYQRHYALKEAQANVAVLDPLTTRPGGYTQAQVTFDSVVTSEALAQRVGKRLHIDPGWVQGHLSVSLLPSLSGTNASPVYAVRGTDHTEKSALLLTSTAAEQARELYIQLNSPDPAALQQVLAPQIQAAQTAVNQAQAAFQNFVTANNAQDLETQITQQRQLIAGLQGQIYAADATQSAALAIGQAQQAVAAGAQAESLTTAMNNANNNLSTLVGLETQYDQLGNNIQTAQQKLTQLQQYELNNNTAQYLPFQDDVRIIDPAQIQSQLLITLLMWGLGVLLGLLLGASVIYLLALVVRPLETAADTGQSFGAPVLARIPRGAGRAS